jgi:hypothetical protein
MLPELFRNIGFSLEEPEIIISNDFNNALKVNHLPFIHPAEKLFTGTFDNKAIIFLNSKFNILWEFDLEKKQSLVSLKSLQILQKKLFNNQESINYLFDDNFCLMAKALCLSHYVIESIVFKMEGNWLLKQQNFKFNGLIECFYLYLTEIQIINNQELTNYYVKYKEILHNSTAFPQLKNLEIESVLSGFVHCFFKNTNQLNCLTAKLKIKN